MNGGLTITALGLALALAVVATIVHRRAVRDADDAGWARRTPAADEVERLRTVVDRRPVLVRALVAVLGVLGLGALGALWRYGPRPSGDTRWADGVRLVDEDGQPLRADDLPAGSIVTAWPEAAGNRELEAVVVLRVAGPSPATGAGEADGGLLAYSRVCTHAGCPVALFRAEDATLYCPCHQATFDARRDAEPVFGPASRPLPRLPLGTDDDGFLVARGGLSAPPGPRA